MNDKNGVEEMHSESESNENEMSTEASDMDNESSDGSTSDSESSDLESTDDSELPWYWQTLVDEATERHEQERRIIVEKLVSDGETETFANQTAHEKLLPVLRKELRKILTEKLEWMHAMKKDCYFKKIIKTRRELLDSGDYDWNEATKLAIHQRKFLLDDLIQSQDEEESDESESIE